MANCHNVWTVYVTGANPTTRELLVACDGRRTGEGRRTGHPPPPVFWAHHPTDVPRAPADFLTFSMAGKLKWA